MYKTEVPIQILTKQTLEMATGRMFGGRLCLSADAYQQLAIRIKAHELHTSLGAARSALNANFLFLLSVFHRDVHG
jgi:hypothetical protein